MDIDCVSYPWGGSWGNPICAPGRGLDFRITFEINILPVDEGSVTETAHGMNHNGSRPLSVVLVEGQDLQSPHFVRPESQNRTAELC